METCVHKDIVAFVEQHAHYKVTEVLQLPKSGSDRIYFRVSYTKPDDHSIGSLLVVREHQVREQQDFIAFSRFFKSVDIPVPEILFVSENSMMYAVEDLGSSALLDVVVSKGLTDEVFELYKNALEKLVQMQVKGTGLFPLPSFDASAVLHDLLYFKFYFADVHAVQYNKTALLKELETLSVALTAQTCPYFMFRDFQARNILVKNNRVYFIDYQGGMEGNPLYDVVSLLFQAKASLPDAWKRKLKNAYVHAMQPFRPDYHVTDDELYQMALLRMLQTLGAYGFRGLFQGKEHFKGSIGPALQQLKQTLPNIQIQTYPELQSLLQQLTEASVLEKYESVKADVTSPLVVHINSFSFIKRGYPDEKSKNGGGYVFDCRGILNPGRLEVFKTQTGRDRGVMEFLETQTRMPEFLEDVFKVVDITVENYIERKFDHLTVSFGCTGGQHRSVYAADALAAHLKNKYGIKVVVQHLEQQFDA
jgi:aminoglycoside/choline kinase family phosphotransferase